MFICTFAFHYKRRWSWGAGGGGVKEAASALHKTGSANNYGVLLRNESLGFTFNLSLFPFPFNIFQVLRRLWSCYGCYRIIWCYVFQTALDYSLWPTATLQFKVPDIPVTMEESNDAAGQSYREDQPQPYGSFLKNLDCHSIIMNLLTVGKTNWSKRCDLGRMGSPASASLISW